MAVLVAVFQRRCKTRATPWSMSRPLLAGSVSSSWFSHRMAGPPVWWSAFHAVAPAEE
ncbi:hypothetical protein O1L55_13600 [Streptomyces albulus]|nr:hypothetical protein [Streptomyces noursei]